MSEDWFSFEDDFECPHCDNVNLVLASGPKDSPVLIISEFPGKDEIKKGKPFTGPAGNVLRSELKYNRVSIRRIRITNIWLHPKNDNEDCFQYGLTECLKEAKDKKLILLCGSDVVKEFAPSAGVKGWEGLEVDSILSADCVMVSPNPAQAFHGGLGEVRLSLRKFCIKAKELL